MSIQSKLKTAITLPPERWVVFIEATVMLAIAGITLRLFPFKSYSHKLGKPLEMGAAEAMASRDISNGTPRELSEIQRHQLSVVAQELARAAQNVPWHPVCLPQALAAKRMLNRRNIATTLYLGVTIDKTSEAIDEVFTGLESQKKMAAHAWLKADNRFVTGRTGHEKFTVIGRFV